MAAAAVEVAEEVTTDLDIFAPSIQQKCIKNEYSSQWSPLASIQLGAPIKLIVNGAEILYLNVSTTKITVHLKIPDADRFFIA